MIKRVLSIAVLAWICTSSFASGNVEGNSSAELRINPPGELPIVDGPVTLTGFIPSIGFISDMATNNGIVRLENMTNVHVEWIESSKVDARNKLSILLSSGTYPDIIQGASSNALSAQDLIRYGTQGLFLPLNDLIEKNGYYIQAMFDALPSVREAITSSDGNIYGLPAVFTDDYHMTMRQKLWVNREWLDRLGLDMPETTDEFYTVMKAFKDEDANGNGDPDDEIPMTGAKRHLEDLPMWIMNAFVPAGGPDDSGDALLNNYEFIVNEEVSFSADKPEFREGLRFIRKMYNEGLIYVTALTQDREQMKSLVDGGETARIGAVASHHPGNFANLGDAENSRFKQYEVMPPIKGPKGQQNAPWFIDAIIEPGQFVITNACEYPDVALRLADYYYSRDFGEHEKGVEGVHWRYVNPSENLVALNGGDAKYQYLKTLTREDNAQINLGPGWTQDLKNEFARAEEYSYEEMLYNATTLYDPYRISRFPYATAPIAADDIDEFNHLRRTIHSYVGESVDRFIINDLDIDTQWNEYLEQLNRIGLTRYLEILRTAY